MGMLNLMFSCQYEYDLSQIDMVMTDINLHLDLHLDFHIVFPTAYLPSELGISAIGAHFSNLWLSMSRRLAGGHQTTFVLHRSVSRHWPWSHLDLPPLIPNMANW